MSDQSNKHNVQGHEGFFERILHPHEGQHRKDSESNPKNGGDRHGEHKHKEGEMDKFEDRLRKDKDEFEGYIRKDKDLEREGDHYGGLM